MGIIENHLKMKALLLLLLLTSVVVSWPTDTARRLKKKCVKGPCLCEPIKKAYLIAMKKNTGANVITKKIFQREVGVMKTKIDYEFKRANKKINLWFEKVNELNKQVIDPKKCKPVKKGKKPSKICAKLAAKIQEAAAKAKALLIKKVVPVQKVPAKTVPVTKPQVPAKTIPAKAAAKTTPAKATTPTPPAPDAEEEAESSADEAEAGLRRMLATPAPTKPVAAKPVTTTPAAAKPVAPKPVAAKPVAAKPVAATPAAPTKAPEIPVVFKGKLSNGIVGLTALPGGVHSYKERIPKIEAGFVKKLTFRLAVAKDQALWGANRVKFFSGACPKIDAILIPKYARVSTDLKNDITVFLKKKRVEFDKNMAKKLKELVDKSTLKPKYLKKLVFPVSRLIAAAVAEAKTHPVTVLKFQKYMKKHYDAKMKRWAKVRVQKEKKAAFIAQFEDAKKAANAKMDTNAKVTFDKQVEKEKKKAKKELGAKIVKKMTKKIETAKKHLATQKSDHKKKVQQAKELPKKAVTQAKEVAKVLEKKAKTAAKKVEAAVKKGDTKAADVAQKVADSVKKGAAVATKVVAAVKGAAKKVGSAVKGVAKKVALKKLAGAKAAVPTKKF